MEFFDSRCRVLQENEWDGDSFIQIRKSFDHFFSLFEKKFGDSSLQECRISVKETNCSGNQRTFIMNGLLLTDFGRFHAKRVGFNEVVCIRELLVSFLNQIKSFEVR